jgi:hypothetical protein
VPPPYEPVLAVLGKGWVVSIGSTRLGEVSATVQNGAATLFRNAQVLPNAFRALLSLASADTVFRTRFERRRGV